MKLAAIIALSITSAFTVSSVAECEHESVERQFDAANLEYDAKGPLVWEIPTKTYSLLLQIDPDDGDMTWRALISDRPDLSYRQVHEVQQDFKYVQLDYVDIGGRKLMAVFSVPHWGEGCAQNITDNTGMFYWLLQDIAERIPVTTTPTTNIGVISI